MKALLSLHEAAIGYDGAPVLHDIHLDIHEGERVALIGASGAGKSTLLARLYQSAPRLCAWCPQESALVGNLSVYHNIYMGQLHRHNWLYNLLNLACVLPRERRKITGLIEALELPDGETPADALSGGQKQRVAIARALHQQARVFIADEPVSALDDWQAERVLALIQTHYPTAVIALHDTRQALQYCDRIVALRDGRIVMDAAASTLSPEALQWVYD